MRPDLCDRRRVIEGERIAVQKSRKNIAATPWADPGQNT